MNWGLLMAQRRFKPEQSMRILNEAIGQAITIGGLCLNMACNTPPLLDEAWDL